MLAWFACMIADGQLSVLQFLEFVSLPEKFEWIMMKHLSELTENENSERECRKQSVN